MPQGYGFLKYGRPMVAAAPLLLGLSAMPAPAHACTGNANDPVFCSQVNGQFVNGVGAFIDNNLSGVPGSSPIPGSTAPFDDDNDFSDLSSPIDDDNDIEPFLPGGEEDFSYTGFVRSPLIFLGSDNSTATPGLEAVNLNLGASNVTVGAGSPVTTVPIAGIPEFQGAGTPAPLQGQQYQFYVIPSPTNPDPNQFSISVGPNGALLFIVAPDGNVPAPIQTLVDQSQGTDNSSGGCQINIEACQAEVGNFYISVIDMMPPESVAPVLNALVNGAPAAAAINTGDSLVNGPDASPDDSSGLSNHYNSGGPSDNSAGDAYVKRQVASITKLREEAANAPDPETRQQKQAELQRKEAGIRLYGSAALRNALSIGDAGSAPVPGRN